MSSASLSQYRLFLFIIMISVITSGCSTISSWFPSEVDETKSWSASKLYAEAKASLNENEYKTAIGLYEKLEARYPHGTYAQQAQLETAYAYYKYEEPESAIAAAERFIKLHPRHEHVDYAYYLRGLITFPPRNNSTVCCFAFLATTFSAWHLPFNSGPSIPLTRTEIRLPIISGQPSISARNVSAS